MLCPWLENGTIGELLQGLNPSPQLSRLEKGGEEWRPPSQPSWESLRMFGRCLVKNDTPHCALYMHRDVPAIIPIPCRAGAELEKAEDTKASCSELSAPRCSNALFSLQRDPRPPIGTAWEMRGGIPPPAAGVGRAQGTGQGSSGSSRLEAVACRRFIRRYCGCGACLCQQNYKICAT